MEGVYFEVEGVYYAKWRGSQSGGGVLCKVEGVSKWWGCILYLQGKSVGRALYLHTKGISLAEQGNGNA